VDSRSADSRRELGRFLKSRRAKVTPADAGIPVGARRRISGLRREEVAILAGLSPTWYTYLEQGRDIHRSAGVVDALARVLRLTEDERRYLHLLALGAVTLRGRSAATCPPSRSSGSSSACPRTDRTRCTAWTCCAS
jgi:hypothetical protein